MNNNIGKNMVFWVGIMEEHSSNIKPDDIILQYQKSKKLFQKKFNNKFNFKPFKPTHKDDKFKENTEIPYTQRDFETQILYLDIILVEAIDQKSIKKNLRGAPNISIINKIEMFLNEQGLSTDIIIPLRTIHDLRSKASAHRKGRDYMKTMDDAKKRYLVSNRPDYHMELFCNLLQDITKAFNKLTTQCDS